MNMEPLRTSVTSAEFVRHFGMWQDRAATRPLYVTHHGRERLVVLSVPNYNQVVERAVRADRIAVEPETFRLGAVFERIAEGFLAVDRRMTVTEINPAAGSYLKAGRFGIIGSPLIEVLPIVHRSALYGHLLRAIQSGEVTAFQQPSTAFEGRELQFQTFPYLDGAACLFRDVTDERNRRETANQYDATMAAMEVQGRTGRARLSSRGLLTFVDPILAAMAGLEAEKLLRARFTDILPLSHRVAAAHEIESVLAGGEPITFQTSLMVNRGGERPVRVAMAELRGEHASGGAVLLITPEAG